MLHFIVQRWHEYTLNNFLDSWGRAIRDRISVLNYEDLAHATALRYGTYVFTDHDRLTDAQLELAIAIADDLLVNPAAARVLSHPRTTKRRVDFLRAMNEGGVNDFRVFRAASDALPDDLRFPVFLRLANEHKGSLSELLHTRAELDAAVASSEHRVSPHLLVVEFCDVSAADGTFRKYGAVRIGDRILPRHVFASKQWMTKLNDDVDRTWIEVEDDYFRRFHQDFEPRLRRIFGLAGVDYGRLDFSLTRDGDIRAWEINTNCMLVTTPDTIHEWRLVQQAESARNIVRALVELDEHSPRPHNGDRIRLNVGGEVRRAAGVSTVDRALRQVGRGLNRLMRLPPARGVAKAFGRARWLARQ